MKFVFVCPDKNRLFESAVFKIVENRGVMIDAAGDRLLDATVALDDPCPYCGRRQWYRPADLACPFGRKL